MSYRIKRYQDVDGKAPYTLWIKKLRGKDLRAATKIDLRIDRVEKGNFGDHKFIREGVWELRIDYGPGYRVYYALDTDQIVLLLIGGDKTRQTRDIESAVRYWRDYQER